MSRTIDRFHADADRLAEGFLIADCIWEVDQEECKDHEALHPQMRRHLVSQAFERGDFALRYWRNDFYRWDAGRGSNS